MNYSKAHKSFAQRLGPSRVLEEPYNFLGPNYETVLNFWKWLDNLTKEQWEIVYQRNVDLNDYDRPKVDRLALEAANSIIGKDYAGEACLAAKGGTAGFATYELIGMHKLLEEGHTLTFVPMFDGL